VIAVGRQYSDHLTKVFGNGNSAVIFKKADEPTDIGDVPGSMRLSWAIARALAPMTFEAFHGREIYLAEGKAV
jgi:hypothetical protein